MMVALRAKNKLKSTVLSIVLTIVIPVIILTRFSGEDWLGPTIGLMIALAFPLLYGLYEWRYRRNINLYSLLGVVSVLLTGGIGLLKLSPQTIALKEAAVPLIIALTIIASQFTKRPLLPALLAGALNDELIRHELKANQMEKAYDRRIRIATYIFAASFLLSTVLNYLLARKIVVSEAGSVAFNQELGRLTALSYPIIVLPSMIVMIIALQYLITGIKRYTKLDLGSIMRG